MGGKRLKFPKRKKFIDSSNDLNFKREDDSISEEEKQRRIQHLKELGLLK